jgi:transcription initiation factor TFIIB
MAKKIIKIAEIRGLTSGRGPTGMCDAAIYAATILTEERRTQRIIAKTSQVTEVTVRNRFQELIENLDIGIQKK